MGLMDDIAKLRKDLSLVNTMAETTFVSTMSPILDAILGGGIAKGKFTQIYSESGVGKSTIVLQFCLNACKQDLKVAYIDSEGGVNSDLLHSIGLDPFVDVNFFLFPVSLFEETEKVLDAILPEIDFVVIDSLTFLVPQKLLESSVGDVLPGLQARTEALFIQKYKYLATKHNVGFIFISQTRTTFNFRGQSTVDSAGGKAVKFSMDCRLNLRKTGDMKKRVKTINGVEEIVYGANVACMCKKNRFTSAFIEGNVAVVYGRGISNLMAYVNFLLKNKYVQQTGAWYKVNIPGFEDAPKLQGINGVSKWAKENIDIVMQLLEQAGGFDLVDKGSLYGDDEKKEANGEG